MAHAIISLCKKTADTDNALPFADYLVGIMTKRALSRARSVVVHMFSSAIQTISALSQT